PLARRAVVGYLRHVEVPPASRTRQPARAFLPAPGVLEQNRRARAVHGMILFPPAEPALVNQALADVALVGPDLDQFGKGNQPCVLDVLIVSLDEEQMRDPSTFLSPDLRLQGSDPIVVFDLRQ